MRAVANETRNLLLGVDRAMKSTVTAAMTRIFIHRLVYALQKVLLTVISERGYKSDQNDTLCRNFRKLWRELRSLG